MITVGIAIEEWKLATFARVLEDSGYSFTKHPGVVGETVMLKVSVERGGLLKLHALCRDALRECRS